VLVSCFIFNGCGRNISEDNQQWKIIKMQSEMNKVIIESLIVTHQQHMQNNFYIFYFTEINKKGNQ